MNGMDLTRLGINDGDSLKISQGSGVVVVSVKKDDKLPAHCIRIPGGHEATAVLGGLFGSVSLEPVVTEQKVAV
jgi:NADH-quinone oxidoreductase subunit G